MGSKGRVLSHEEAKKQPEGTVFTYPSTDGTTQEAVSRGGRLYYNWGMGIEMPECWSRVTFTLKETKLTYKQATKYPVGTVFEGTRGNLYVVTGDSGLLGIQGDNMGHRVPRRWDNGVGYFTLVTKDAVPKEPTIAEVCEERGWGVFSDNGSHSVSFDPYICMYSGPDSFPASKVARIIDIIEEK